MNTHRGLALLILLCCNAAGPALAAPPVQDTMAQRVLPCTICHGPQGRAAADGYQPRIAGKPAAYLYNQLLNFRDGRRRYGPMATLIEPLGDDYLREIAEHFAALDLPHAPPAPVQASVAELQRGEQLVLHGDAPRHVPACVACHGAALTGMAPAIPGLLGLPRDYIGAQFGAWLSGQRRAQSPDCMAEITRRLGPGDVSAVAAWLASRPVPAVAKAARALPQALPLDCGGVPR